MATAIFDVSIKKVGKSFIEVLFEELQEGGLGLEPSLVMRALAEPLGFQSEELYDEAFLKRAMPETFLFFLVLHTKKNTALFRVGLSKEHLLAFEKGMGWQSYDYAMDRTEVLNIAQSEDGKLAITGLASCLLPSASAATIQGSSYRGLGAIKKWLSHPHLLRVGVAQEGWFTAGGGIVKRWNKTGAKCIEEIEIEGEISAFANIGDAFLVGTSTGKVLSYPGARTLIQMKGPVRDIKMKGEYCIIADVSAQVAVGLSGLGKKKAELELVNMPTNKNAVLGVDINAEGEWVICDASETAWKGIGKEGQSYEEVGEEVIHFKGVYDFKHLKIGDTFYSQNYRTTGIHALNLKDGKLEEIVKAPFKADLLRVSNDGRTLFAASSYPTQDIVLFRDGRCAYHETDGLFQTQVSPSAKPTISPDGKWVAIGEQKDNYRDGYVSLINAEEGKKYKLFNPNTSNEWINDIHFINDEELWVSYANHNSCVWSVEKKSVIEEKEQADSLDRFGDVFVETFEQERVKCWRNKELISDVEMTGNTLLDASQDGAVLLTISFSTIHVIKNGEVWSLEGAGFSCCLSPNGKWLFYVGEDEQSEAILYEVETRKAVHTFEKSNRSSLYVEDDGTTWTMSSEEILVHDPDGGLNRRITSPPPREIKRKIKDAYWDGTGNIVWIFSDMFRPPSGASVSTHRTILWDKEGKIS